MLPKKFAFACALAVALAAAGCSIKNTEIGGSYPGATLRESAHPVVTEMFNHAFKAVELPAGAVASGEYVAVYRLSSGKVEDQWWCYLAEDWMVDKIRAAGATPVERNASAAHLLEGEDEYFAAPKTPSPGGVTAPSPASLAKLRAGDVERTPYRATRALAYRVVAADLWLDRFNSPADGSEPTVRANAKVVINLRTIHVQTGEVLWSGSVSGTARKNVKISRLMGFMGIYDWDDWDDWDHGPWWWWWRWDDDHAPVHAPPPEGEPLDEPGKTVEEPAEDDETAEEPVPPAEALFWNW